MLIVTLLNAFVCLWAHACIIAHLSWNGLGDALILKSLFTFWKANVFLKSWKCFSGCVPCISWRCKRFWHWFLNRELIEIQRCNLKFQGDLDCFLDSKILFWIFSFCIKTENWNYWGKTPDMFSNFLVRTSLVKNFSK